MNHIFIYFGDILKFEFNITVRVWEMHLLQSSIIYTYIYYIYYVIMYVKIHG